MEIYVKLSFISILIVDFNLIAASNPSSDDVTI